VLVTDLIAAVAVRAKQPLAAPSGDQLLKDPRMVIGHPPRRRLAP
jgi:hypothetical protein